MSRKKKVHRFSWIEPAKQIKLMLPLLALPLLGMVVLVQAQFVSSDPGPRPGPAGAGGPLASVNADPNLLSFFNDGLRDFNQLQSVQGTIPGETGAGLGPHFNNNACGGCHAQPASGGTSPSLNSPQRPLPNPQVAVATLDGATNSVPFFITSDGPVREARFPFLIVNGVKTSRPDGSVHDLFTIKGRTDATNTVGISGSPQTCTVTPDDFNQAHDLNDLIFRIPTPVFGLGLIENIRDDVITDNMQANASLKQSLGISGHPNVSGNDGTNLQDPYGLSKFGWKAQNRSLQMFAGEAYNVEQGVTNEIFPTERTNDPNCLFNATPEDSMNFGSTGIAEVSDIQRFVNFMRFLDQPTPSTTTPGGATSISNGRTLFGNIHCDLCHTPTLTTVPSSITSSLSNANANLFSDLLVHHMGTGLADGVSQGTAGPDEFRTAPLWGVGQRIFFLHDGRTRDIKQAILQHSSSGSEANAVINNFNALSETQKQDLLNFLRSL